MAKALQLQPFSSKIKREGIALRHHGKGSAGLPHFTHFNVSNQLVCRTLVRKVRTLGLRSCKTYPGFASWPKSSSERGVNGTVALLPQLSRLSNTVPFTPSCSYLYLNEEDGMRRVWRRLLLLFSPSAPAQSGIVNLPKRRTPVDDVRTCDIRPEELAYYAGILDGEGCVVFNKHGRKSDKYRYLAYVRIANTHRELLEEIQQKFGGGITKSHQYPNRKRVYNLEMYGPTMRKFLEDILPYLRIKRRHAELVLQILPYGRKEEHGNRCRSLPQEELDKRDLILKELSILNKRGV